MSRPRGGIIGVNATPAASAINSAASGVWTLREVEALKRAGTWPASFGGPASINGLQLWLDAADESTLFDATTGGSPVAANGGVARWDDKSGNARHFTQSTGGRRPLRKTSQQNGKDTLLLDGSDDCLVGSDFLDLTSRGMSAFLVYKRNATGFRHELLSKTQTSSGFGWVFYHGSGGELNFRTQGSGRATAISTAASVSADGYVVVSLVLSSGQVSSGKMYRNGSALSMASPTYVGSGLETAIDTSGPIQIGVQEYAGDLYFAANINAAEIVIYDSALPDTDRAPVENYLIAKWGIT